MSQRTYRRFTAQEKLAILKEAEQPGVTTAEVRALERASRTILRHRPPAVEQRRRDRVLALGISADQLISPYDVDVAPANDQGEELTRPERRTLAKRRGVRAAPPVKHTAPTKHRTPIKHAAAAAAKFRPDAKRRVKYAAKRR